MKVVVIESPAELDEFFNKVACDECDECNECDEYPPEAPHTSEQDIWEYSRDMRTDLDLAGNVLVKQKKEIKQLKKDVELLMTGMSKLIKTRMKKLIHPDPSDVSKKAEQMAEALHEAFTRIREKDKS